MTTETRLAGGWLWRPLLGASLTQLVLGIARPAVSYAGLELGATSFEIGLIASSFAVLPMFMAILVGRLAGRFRHIGLLPFISGVLLLSGCVTAALAESLMLLVVASALLGMANLAVLIGAQAWIARSARAERYNDGFGWMTAGMAAGQAVGPVVAGVLIGPQGTVHPEGIVTAFWAAAAVAVTVMVCFASSASRVDEVDDGERVHSSLDILRIRGVGRWIFVSAAVLTTVEILVAYLPVVGEERGIAPVVVGALLATRGVTTALSRLLLGRLSRWWSQSTLLVLSTAGSAAALVVVALVPWVVVLFVAMAIGGFLLGIGQPITMTAIALALPRHVRSSGLALRLLGNRVALTVVPLAAGAISGFVGVAAVFWLQVVLLTSASAWELASRKGSDEPLP